MPKTMSARFKRCVPFERKTYCKTNDAGRIWKQWTQILTVVNARRDDATRDDHVDESTTGKPPHGGEERNGEE